jgi:UPF0716 protein FxsA
MKMARGADGRNSQRRNERGDDFRRGADVRRGGRRAAGRRDGGRPAGRGGVSTAEAVMPLRVAIVGVSVPATAHRDPGARLDTMLPLLFVIFIVVPIIELAVIIQVGQAIGVLPTIALLIGVSVVGAWLVKREGLGVYKRFRRQMEAGAIPGKEVADAFMIMFAGALLISPGFVTDVLGVLLLLPPVRAAVRATALSRLAHRIRRY